MFSQYIIFLREISFWSRGCRAVCICVYALSCLISVRYFISALYIQPHAYLHSHSVVIWALFRVKRACEIKERCDSKKQHVYNMNSIQINCTREFNLCTIQCRCRRRYYFSFRSASFFHSPTLSLPHDFIRCNCNVIHFVVWEKSFFLAIDFHPAADYFVCFVDHEIEFHILYSDFLTLHIIYM